MTVTDVLSSPQFVRLPAGSKTFLREYLDNGWDKIAAAKAAWQCKDDKSAQAQADRALRDQRIASLVALVDPTKVRMTREEALAIAAKNVREATKPADVFKGLELIAEWEGWNSESRPPDAGAEKSIYDQAEELCSRIGEQVR